jgi:hypothetical protein
MLHASHTRFNEPSLNNTEAQLGNSFDQATRPLVDLISNAMANDRPSPSLAPLLLCTVFFAAAALTTAAELGCNSTVAEQEAVARWSMLSELTFSRDCKFVETLASRGVRG